MPRSRNRERDASEFYKKQIRELKKQVRQLEQRLKYYEKHEQTQDDDVASDHEDTHPKEIKLPCGECGKGTLRYFELIGKIYEECDLCGYRKKVQG